MSITSFLESDMKFEFDSDLVYRIEHSATHLSLGEGFKICECVIRRSNSLCFIEAKSSFAYADRHEHFKDQIKDIVEKFQNSIIILAGLQLQRPYPQKDILPKNLCDQIAKTAKYKCILIVRECARDTLVQLADSLSQALAKDRKRHCISDILVLNHEMAIEKGFVKKQKAA